MKNRFEVIAGDILVGGEVVIDKKTGLHWTKRPLGGEFTFDEAVNLRRGDWRLPTAEELVSIIDYKYEIPACLDGFDFTTESEMVFWSSSSYVGDAFYAWYVNFYDGSVGYGAHDTELSVRLVKDNVNSTKHPKEVDNIKLNTDTRSGKEKRLTKQREYWKRRFEDLDKVMKYYPNFLKKAQRSMNDTETVSELKKKIRAQEALIKVLDDAVTKLNRKQLS